MPVRESKAGEEPMPEPLVGLGYALVFMERSYLKM